MRSKWLQEHLDWKANVLKAVLHEYQEHLPTALCNVVLAYSYRHFAQVAPVCSVPEVILEKWKRPSDEVVMYAVGMIEKNKYILALSFPTHNYCYEITEQDFPDVTDFLTHHYDGFPTLDICYPICSNKLFC